MDYSVEYEAGLSINDIFHTGSVGMATGRDRLTIHWTAEDVRETVNDFISLSPDEAREQYNLGRDTHHWQIPRAQADLRNNPDVEQHVTTICYRPFDTRWTYYTGQTGFHSRPNYSIIRHFPSVKNVGLCVCRIVTSPDWNHILITDKITEKCYVSNRGSESVHVFPLYLYPEPGELIEETERTLNLKPEFITALSESLGLPQNAPHQCPEGIVPEQILSYIYAVLHSPTYRDRYYEFLRYDFPRIPLPKDIDHFRTLAALGQQLVDLHLLKNITPTTHRFEGQGNATVERVRYEDEKVWINTTQHFTDVPEAVWKYEIGAYQVCEKWLKDRKKRNLSLDELNHYRKILVVITETIRIMDAIDDILW